MATVNHMAYCTKANSSYVLLATALVEAKSRTGNYQVIRALLDQGSQASFVTEATVQSLGLKRITVTNVISGLSGQNSSVSKSMVLITLRSKIDPKIMIDVKAYVLSKITSYMPGSEISLGSWVELSKVALADPQFDVPNGIDMLLGAEVYSQILREGVLQSPADHSLVAQCTTLGWVLSGPVGIIQNQNKVTVLHTYTEEFDLKRFWELESEGLLTSKMLTPEEQRCEDFFAATTQRDAYGRYVVRLPFREEVRSCKNGDSREIAVRRFKNLERKFATDSILKERYTEVINEYLNLDHMKLVHKPEETKEQAVYLPHHAVIREDKSTTKVRVVFDASCKNKNGISLNDTLMVGPSLQPDLRQLIMNWRKNPICVVADIIKMYRMVRMAEEDCDYQRIVWRNNSNEELLDYKLLTVTFGTASAPYLAVKVLNQIAIDYKEKYPMAAERVAKEYFMDDWMSGCQTAEEGVELIKEMSALLKEGGLLLQKLSSNKKELLEMIEQKETKFSEGETENKQEEREDNRKVEQKLDNLVKILGLTWNRNHDEFQYLVKMPPLSVPVTKRKIISDVSRLFDPLGWVAPSVVLAKIFIQRLWIAGTGWDEEPPTEIVNDWYTYRNELSGLFEFRLPRWLFTQPNDETVELHGFSDASNVAFAAVVYLRVISASGDIHVGLVGAKTRVAPVKQVRIPRLELCGAVLVSKLLVEIAEVLNIQKKYLRAWTDSTIVLAWLSKHASNWKTFVANRVADIHTTFDSSQWSHVSTKDNPADCASRGVQPADLAKLDMWKFGPRFLGERHIKYTKLKNNNTHEDESIKVHLGTVDQSILEKYSSLNKLVRIVAYCRRFIIKNNTYSNICLSSFELTEALNTCIRLAQSAVYGQEIEELNTNGQLKSKGSKLLSLAPFLDNRGLLRVGGRIAQSQTSESLKHPIVLPYESALSRLVIDDAHRKTLHGDIQLMLNYIRSAYWIVGCKTLVKHHIRKCVMCIRHKAKLLAQFMGSLPSVRVKPARAFSNSGVDYAGPIMLRTTKGRGHKAYKGYICLFVCMVTKAVHIELVSDLTSRGFLEAFKRFVARRGHCANVYSDNATNFVGASKELKELFHSETSTMVQEVTNSLAMQGTNWHLIPPKAPNFGGLWEGGIKSTKYHIKRVIGESTLTYEEMSTLLIQIEACLNSRPLTVINNSPEEPIPITPGHFLIGEPLVTVPEINYENSRLGSLRRWQVTQARLQSFWRRWSGEYLTQLMHRYKWAYKIPEPAVGDVVLVKEDDLPPSRWLLGRVLEKYPGPDGITRVVSLKYKNSTIKRSTSKLCILPIESN